jgi:hypothetical protein
LSSVNLSAVADSHHQNADLAVRDVADDSVFAYPVFPKPAQLGPFKGLPYAAWVIQNRQPSSQKSSDAPGNLLIHFGQGLQGLVIDLN